jgi:protoporphyrinogen oxidase
MAERSFTIIGGGPAGLTAAYELTRHNIKPVVLEKDPIVGGISRTESYKGFHFDMGGHRFFTKSEEVNEMWHEVLLEAFLRRPRLSRIYYKSQFFYYPLKPGDTLKRLGVIESARIMLSYARWQLFPYKQENSLEEWVTNRFGKRLFETFFKTYTEKVWGISCKELKAEWAAQRIKDLSIKTLLVSMFLKPRKTIKTLIEEFDYPRQGPGMLWNAVKDRIHERGGTVRMNSNVVRINRHGNRILSVVVEQDGVEETIPGTDFITSMPLTEFVKKLDPPAPPAVAAAAGHLKYRDFLTVCLIVNKPALFPDNWIYIHDPTVKVGRIQNFKNWSPDMVPDQSKTSLGLEYFCNEGDAVWNLSEEELIELGKREIDQIGLARAADVEDGRVFRVPKAYPVYDGEYAAHLETIKNFIEGLENCRTVGRNGLHRYNNQDHSMLAGMYAVRNMLLGEKTDLWSVNADQEYHEEVKEGHAARGPGRNTRRVVIEEEQAEAVLEEELAVVFGKFDRVAAGASGAVLLGGIIFLMTMILLAKGPAGGPVGENLRLLGQYFPGYHVSLIGAVIGLAYGLVFGFLAGYLFALVTNVATTIYKLILARKAAAYSMWNLLEYI